MKKITGIIGCLLLLAFGSSYASAGDSKESGGSIPSPLIGLEGGINLANLHGSNAGETYKSRLGFVGGAFVNIHLSPHLALQPELLYEQKGGKINGNTYKLDYVEVPTLLEITLGGHGLNPGILVGPAFNSNVASHGVVNVKKSDVGLVLGGQVAITKFIVSARYEIGLNDVNSNENLKNGTFTLLVGYSIL